MYMLRMVEHAAVNRRVVGSSPTGGAKKSRETPVFLLFFTLLADPNRRLCHT